MRRLSVLVSCWCWSGHSTWLFKSWCGAMLSVLGSQDFTWGDALTACEEAHETALTTGSTWASSLGCSELSLIWRFSESYLLTSWLLLLLLAHGHAKLAFLKRWWNGIARQSTYRRTVALAWGLQRVGWIAIGLFNRARLWYALALLSEWWRFWDWRRHCEWLWLGFRGCTWLFLRREKTETVLLCCLVLQIVSKTSIQG